MKYYIEIAGVDIRKVIEIEADSREEAFNKIRELYDKDCMAFLYDRTKEMEKVNKYDFHY